jgi:hypothetical protein
MIPTFTLSKNDLAYLLFRTLALPFLRQLQGLVLFLSSPFLMIGEHRWLQRKEAKNHQNRESAVREDFREAVGYWFPRSTTKIAMRHWVCTCGSFLHSRFILLVAYESVKSLLAV